MIRGLGKLRVPEATQTLLQTALYGSGETRDAALEELKRRPMHVYVPQLLAAIPAEVNSKFEIHVLPGGGVVHEHEVEVIGRDADQKFTYENVIRPSDPSAAALTTPQA